MNMGVPNQRRHENAAFLAGSTGTHSLILHNSCNLHSLTNKRGQKEKKGMITRHQIHVEGKDVETGHLILRNVTQNTESSDTRPLRLGAERRMARRAYSTEGREYLPPPPSRLAGYLNLAAVHSLERELSLLLINEGKSFVRKNLYGVLPMHRPYMQ